MATVRSDHCVRLACGRLAISENARVHPLLKYSMDVPGKVVCYIGNDAAELLTTVIVMMSNDDHDIIDDYGQLLTITS